MSGIFKSVKKAFKKIGKVIKKIAPVLIVAAAVYFGGSYLMASMGGASAQAAGSVATSFTKSAGMWKSFLGGISNGTASSSAVAFAEGSYKASQAGMALSGQVAAGTAAVNSLSTVGSVGEAVKTGVGMAKSAFSSGSDPQTSWNILFNGLNDTTATPAAATAASASGYETGIFHSESADAASSGYLESDPLGGGSGVLGEEVASTSGFTSQGETLETAPRTWPAQQVGVATTQPATTTLAETLPAAAEKVDKPSIMQQMIFDMREQALLDRQDYNALVIAQNKERASIDKMKLGLSAGGLLLNAFGQAQQAKAAEEERKRRLEWKPTEQHMNPYKGLIT